MPWYICEDGEHVNGRGEAVGFNEEKGYQKRQHNKLREFCPDYPNEQCCECPRMGECEYQ